MCGATRFAPAEISRHSRVLNTEVERRVLDVHHCWSSCRKARRFSRIRCAARAGLLFGRAHGNCRVVPSRIWSG
jgi:hypothetical protein